MDDMSWIAPEAGSIPASGGTTVEENSSGEPIPLGDAGYEKAKAEEKSQKKKGPDFVHLAMNMTIPWHTPEGEPWVSIGRRHYPIGSADLDEELAEGLYAVTGIAVSTAKLREITRILAAKAKRGPEHSAHLRVATHKDELWVDLADKFAQAVRVRSNGWEVVPAPGASVKFFRPKNMRPLPVPVAPGDRGGLTELLNLPDDDTLRLTLTWLTFALFDDRPCPVLVISGPQGSAKSSFSRMIRTIVDPNAVPLLGPPKGTDFVAHAKNNRMLCFDNMSDLKPDLADDLCRLATGGGFGGRRLFTNDDVAAFAAKRPVLLNGIPELTTRGDLADRALVLQLKPIPPEHRRTEDELREAFENAHPHALAALLNAVVVGLQRLPEVKRQLTPLSRMADFTQWGIAVAPAFGWDGPAFLAAYEANRQAAIELVTEDDPVAPPVLTYLEGRPQKRWTGIASELLKALQNAADENDRGRLPKTPGAFGRALARAEPILGAHGYVIDRPTRTARSRTMTIRPAA
jgi:putative DNA primase/helicase